MKTFIEYLTEKADTVGWVEINSEFRSAYKYDEKDGKPVTIIVGTDAGGRDQSVYVMTLDGHVSEDELFDMDPSSEVSISNEDNMDKMEEITNIINNGDYNAAFSAIMSNK